MKYLCSLTAGPLPLKLFYRKPFQSNKISFTERQWKYIFLGNTTFTSSEYPLIAQFLPGLSSW